MVEEDEEVREVTDRNYWENIRGTTKTVKVVDQVLELINQIIPGYELKYNKFYIGLAYQNQTDNFIIFRAKKKFSRMEIRLKRSDETEQLIEDSGLELMDYAKRGGRYRIILKPGETEKNSEILKELIRQAKEIEEQQNL